MARELDASGKAKSEGVGVRSEQKHLWEKVYCVYSFL